MHFHIDKEQLLIALQRVQGAIDNRPMIPILAHVLLDARDGQLRLCAHEANLRIDTSVAASITEAGATTVPGKLLFDFVRKLPNKANLEFKLHQSARNATQSLKINVRKIEMELPTLPAADFPESMLGAPQASSELLASDLKWLLDQTRFAASNDEARYNLMGVYIELEQFQLRTVASDGRRLAMAHLSIEQGAGFNGILPKKTVQELVGLLDREHGNAQLAMDATGFFLKLGASSMRGRLVDGKYPDYKRVIPSSSQANKVLIVDREELTQAIERACVVAGNQDVALKIDVATHQITLKLETADHGTFHEPIGAEYEGETFEILFNPKLLLESLQHLPSVKVQFLFGTSNSAVVIKSYVADQKGVNSGDSNSAETQAVESKSVEGKYDRNGSTIQVLMPLRSAA